MYLLEKYYVEERRTSGNSAFILQENGGEDVQVIEFRFNYLHIFTTIFLKNDINTNITLCYQALDDW
jgi:hypothetical protein